MISAILLAAGQSTRMNGENKLIKEIDDIPIIKHALNTLALFYTFRLFENSRSCRSAIFKHFSTITFVL